MHSVSCRSCERGISGKHPPQCTPESRFWRRVDRSGDCWLWMGSKRPRGYGQFALTRDKHDGAHRIAWALTNGRVPDGLSVLHHCDNPSCVNPKHLFLGTQKDNVEDMDRKGRRVVNAPTHCKHGHPFNAANTIYGNGRRSCKACHRVIAARAHLRDHPPRFCQTCGSKTKIRNGVSWERCVNCRRNAGAGMPAPERRKEIARNAATKRWAAVRGDRGEGLAELNFAVADPSILPGGVVE